jgi:hypothetical protein
MFNAKKELETLRRKYDQLQKDCEGYRTTAEIMHERLYKIEHGERCEGVYCESCKNAIPGGVVEYLTSDDRRITIGDKTICSLSVPCPCFEREE